MKKAKKRKEWTLDDGSVWTVTSLMEKLGCAHTTAYARLHRSGSSAAHVLRPCEKNKDAYGYKVYTLDDGSQWTAASVAKHTGVAKSTASTRLSCYTDPETVLAPPKYKSIEKKMSNLRKGRMYYDPLGHWALLNKNTGVNK